MISSTSASRRSTIPARHRPMAVEDQLAFVGRQREHPERDAVAIGDLGIEGAMGGRLGDALLVRTDDLGRRLRADVIVGDHGTDRVAHARQRQRQHLMTQRLVDRRQPVEPQQADHRPQRGAVDEQGEQHEAGPEDRDEALDLGLDRAVLGDPERERQRDRAAQRAPHDHELVARADRVREAGGAEQRQQAEQHHRARDERGERDHADQQHVVPGDADHQPRHQHRGQDEDQRARPERQLLPEVEQEGPVLGREAPARLDIDHQPRHHHRGHARDFKVVLAHAYRRDRATPGSAWSRPGASRAATPSAP